MNLEENNVYFRFNKNQLIDNFNEYNKLGTLYYPVKTNSNEAILEELIGLNSGFLVTTLKNFEKLQKLKANMDKVCIINVLAEKETVKYYYDNGVRFFTFDNMKSLLDFSEYADLSKVKIAIRLSTMDIFKDEFTHLGADSREALEMIEFLKDKCSDYGIAFYIQKNLKSKENVLESTINHILNNYKNLGLKFINIGGVALKSKDYIDILEDFKLQLDLEEIILEVGRDLVSNTMDLETRIIRSKNVSNQKIVIIKNGIYSGFFQSILYGKNFEMYLVNKENKQIKFEHEKTENNEIEIFLCGGSSESGDKLGKVYIDSKYEDELLEGGIIVIKNVGAYFEEFFMGYASDLNVKIQTKIKKAKCL